MPYTAAQICTLSAQIARVPGFLQQAGQLLTMALDELCQTYDFELARGTVYTPLNPTLVAPVGNSLFGSGPYPLPADYLRANFDGVFWTLNGVVYPLIPIDLAEFDRAVQQPGLAQYPRWFCTDLSLSDEAQQGQTTPVFYVYPPPSGAFVLTIRYFRQMPEIATPETSSTIPWFPLQTYLITRVAGELMRITNDDRLGEYLGDGPQGAQGILRRYLNLKDDTSNRASKVKLDERSFGPGQSNLPNTKLIGWALAGLCVLPSIMDNLHGLMA